MSAGTHTVVTVAAAGTVSSAYEWKGANRGSFKIPAVFDGTNCAVHVSNDIPTPSAPAPTNFVACPIEGNEVQPIVVAVNKSYSLPVKAASFRWIRFVVDAQTLACDITLFTRD